MRVFAFAICLLSPGWAFGDPLPFLRIHQTGDVGPRTAAIGYGIEASRGLLHLEGSGKRRRAYVGATHRLSLGYGIADGLALGCEQSLKQDATDTLSIGVFAPELRVAPALFGPEWLRTSGLAIYVQGRVRVKARRPSTMVGGLTFDRQARALKLAARAGFETTVVAADSRENGFRYELGIARPFSERWQLAAEAWGHMLWRSDSREHEHHLGPSLQLDVQPFQLGLQAALGVSAHRAVTALDAVGMARVAMRF